MPDGPGGTGLRVPRWFIYTVSLLVTIVTATVTATLVVAQRLHQSETTQDRLCRLEGGVALLLDRQNIVHDLRPYRTCAGPR